MRSEEKAAPAAKASEGGTGNRISRQAIRNPDNDSIICSHRLQASEYFFPSETESGLLPDG